MHVPLLLKTPHFSKLNIQIRRNLLLQGPHDVTVGEEDDQTGEDETKEVDEDNIGHMPHAFVVRIEPFHRTAMIKYSQNTGQTSPSS